MSVWVCLEIVGRHEPVRYDRFVHAVGRVERLRLAQKPLRARNPMTGEPIEIPLSEPIRIVECKHLREVRKGDRILYYHTGKEKAVVGVARAVSDAYPDPKDRTGKAFVVEVEPERALPASVPLAAIKARPSFKSFPLVRIPRLSVMPVTASEWQEIEKMSSSL